MSKFITTGIHGEMATKVEGSGLRMMINWNRTLDPSLRRRGISLMLVQVAFQP